MSNTELRTAIESAAQLLITKQMTLAFAESATAGRAAAEFSLACNAGKFLKGGFICYDATLKCEILLVPEEMLKKQTPESMEVTKAIAEGLTKLVPADIHIGITGLPCPGGSETAEKPVGTMFIAALKYGKPWFSERQVYQGTHQQIIEQTIQRIGTLLLKHLS